MLPTIDVTVSLKVEGFLVNAPEDGFQLDLTFGFPNVLIQALRHRRIVSDGLRLHDRAPGVPYRARFAGRRPRSSGLRPKSCRS
jgi:hypothetical protein